MPVNRFQIMVAGFKIPSYAQFFVKLDENPLDEDKAWQWPVEKDHDQLRRE
jgi:hypothetical protein